MVPTSWIKYGFLLMTCLIVQPIAGPHKLFCGSERELYDIRTHECRDGQVVQIHRLLCGPECVPYDPLSHECVDNMVVPKLGTTELPNDHQENGKNSVVVVTSRPEQVGGKNGASNTDRVVCPILLLLVLQIVLHR